MAFDGPVFAEEVEAAGRYFLRPLVTDNMKYNLEALVAAEVVERHGSMLFGGGMS